jgi:hypothetical protein
MDYLTDSGTGEYLLKNCTRGHKDTLQKFAMRAKSAYPGSNVYELDFTISEMAGAAVPFTISLDISGIIIQPRTPGPN